MRLPFLAEREREGMYTTALESNKFPPDYIRDSIESYILCNINIHQYQDNYYNNSLMLFTPPIATYLFAFNVGV